MWKTKLRFSDYMNAEKYKKIRFFVFFCGSLLSLVFLIQSTHQEDVKMFIFPPSPAVEVQEIGIYPLQSGEADVKSEPGEVCQIEKSSTYSFHPVSCAWQALNLYKSFMRVGENEYRHAFLKFVDYIILNSEQKGNDLLLPYDFSWDYVDYHTYSPPWYSGMAQGMAASVFVRAWEVSGEQQYLDFAYSSLHPLTYESPYNLILIDGYDFWIEEYPGFVDDGDIRWDHTLNGGLLGAYGFYDYYLATGSQESYTLFHKAMKTFIAHSEEYDAGYGPAYSLIDMAQLRKVFYLETASHMANSLAVYKFEVLDSQSRETISSFSFNDGCKHYPIDSFSAPKAFTLFFKKSSPSIELPVSEIKIFDEPGSLIKTLKPSVDFELDSKFEVQIPKLRNSSYVKFIATYNDLYKEKYNGGDIVSLRMQSSCDYSLGSIELSGDGRWHTHEFMLPQRLSPSDSAYLGWRSRREIDTRHVKDTIFEKIIGEWNGSWLRLSLPSSEVYKNALAREKLLVRLTYKDTSKEKVFLRMWNGNGIVLGSLSNAATGQWKTDEFEVDSKLFKKLVSPNTKLPLVERSYLNYDRLFDCSDCRHWINKWKSEQHIDLNSLTLMFYANNRNSQIANFQLSNVKLCGRSASAELCDPKVVSPSIPRTFQDSVGNRLDSGLVTISLLPDSYTLINIPHSNDEVDEVYQLHFDLSTENETDGEVDLYGFGKVHQTMFALDKYSLQGVGKRSIDLIISTGGKTLTTLPK